MAEIISLNDKLKLSQDKKDAIARKQKIQAVQKVFQCTQCAFKCERCGQQIRPDPSKDKKCEHQFVKVPYHFCESCEEEYLDYINRLKGKGDKERLDRISKLNRSLSKIKRIQGTFTRAETIRAGAARFLRLISIKEISK
ncbi:MAG: hypothetical protein MUD09_08160 [Desulfobacterales bacterium]|nr:hypothetical protein [Desulfobacterales bacterium]